MIHSNLNIKLRGRKQVIEIKEIISKGEGFMVVCDKHGKEHKIHRTDFYISSGGWYSISVGSEIEVFITESVLKLKILSVKEPIASPVWENIPVPGYLWVCEACKKRGVVSCETGDDPSSSVNRIYADHENLSPKCDHDKVRIFSHDFVEMTEAAKIIAFKREN